MSYDYKFQQASITKHSWHLQRAEKGNNKADAVYLPELLFRAQISDTLLLKNSRLWECSFSSRDLSVGERKHTA